MQQDNAVPVVRSAQQAFAYSLAANTPVVYPEPIATHEEVCIDREVFDSALFKLLTAFGITLKVPKIANQEINIHLLYNEVTRRGGLEQVIAKKMFVLVCEPFNFPASFTNKSFVVRKLYCNMLHHFEQVYYFRKSGCPVVPPPLNDQQHQHRTRFRDHGSPNKRANSRPRPQPLGRSISTPRNIMQGLPNNFCSIGHNSSPMHSPCGKRKQGADFPGHHAGLLGHACNPSKLAMPFQKPYDKIPLGLKPLIHANNMSVSGLRNHGGSGNAGRNNGFAENGHKGKTDPSPTTSCSSGSEQMTPPVLAPHGLETGLEFPCRIIAQNESYYTISMHVPGADAMVGQLMKSLPPDVVLADNVLPHQLIYKRGSSTAYGSNPIGQPCDLLANNMGASAAGDGRDGTCGLDHEDGFGMLGIDNFREWDHSAAGAAAGVLIDPAEVSGDATADVVAQFSAPDQQECAKKLRLASNGGWAPINMGEHCWPPAGGAGGGHDMQPYALPAPDIQGCGPNTYAQFMPCRDQQQYSHLQGDDIKDQYEASLHPGQGTHGGTGEDAGNDMPTDCLVQQHPDNIGIKNNNARDGAPSETTDNSNHPVGSNFLEASGAGGAGQNTMPNSTTFHASMPHGSMAGTSVCAYTYNMGHGYEGNEANYQERSSGMGSRPGTSGGLPSARNNGNNMSTDGVGHSGKMMLAQHGMPMTFTDTSRPTMMMVPNKIMAAPPHAVHGYYPGVAHYPMMQTSFGNHGYGAVQYSLPHAGYGQELIGDADPTPNYGMLPEAAPRALNYVSMSYGYQPAMYTDAMTSRALQLQRRELQHRRMMNTGVYLGPHVSAMDADGWETEREPRMGGNGGMIAAGRSNYSHGASEGAAADEEDIIHMPGRHQATDGTEELFDRMDISGGGAPPSTRMQGPMPTNGLHVDTARGDANLHGASNGDMPTTGTQVLTPASLLNNPGIGNRYLDTSEPMGDLSTPDDIVNQFTYNEQNTGGILIGVDGQVGQAGNAHVSNAGAAAVIVSVVGAAPIGMIACNVPTCTPSDTQRARADTDKAAKAAAAYDGVTAISINMPGKSGSMAAKQVMVMSEAVLEATQYGN